MANRTGKVGRPFRPGQSGNPGGRPKSLIDIEALARSKTTEAIEALTAALSMPKERVAAAIALLDRGWGRPRQAIDATVHRIEGGIDAPPRPATVEDAEAWLERRRRELAELGGPKGGGSLN